MMEQTASAIRPAEDIAEDIAALIRSYPPLAQSRHWFTWDVAEGVVTLRGNIKSAIAQRVLLDNAPHIPGVIRVDADDLHNDEDLRLKLASLLPPGIGVRVDYGRVLVSGTLPPRHKAEALIKRLEKTAGVRRVESQIV
jgi:osmotically-inducible protein OsmY